MAFPAADAVRRVLSRRLVRAGMVTYLFSGFALVANLVTGIIVARALGPDGRGVIVALVTVSQLAGFLFSVGVAQSLSYFLARRPQDGPSLLTTWVLMLLPLTALAIAIGELLLPTIFAADDQAIALGRWFLLTIVLVVGLELNYGLLLGTEDFFVYNALRLAQPLLTALSLWPSGPWTFSPWKSR
jgi:O-antigen/teichoic acid export membrane protein